VINTTISYFRQIHVNIATVYSGVQFSSELLSRLYRMQ